MKHLLATYYDVQIEAEIILDQRKGYKSADHTYFIISADNKEVIHMEQAALAYYLAENNYTEMAIPIPTIHGEWILHYQGENYLVLQVNQLKDQNGLSQGKQLAAFHHVGAMYRYEPHEISSYGQWKQLWINKLTIYENKLMQEAEKHPSDYYRFVMDILPYIVGISENAIQYVQETEQEYRFDEVDQGTISFQRFANSMSKPVFWTDELVYDHPARDLAENIRFYFLQNDKNSTERVLSFLHDYQLIRPLSVFSWRLLYARLIFPIHIYDCLKRGFDSQEYDQVYTDLTKLMAQQTVYEERLRDFFTEVAVDPEALQIPVLHWL
ncbi:hypothetical protein [Lentibacillus sp. Marseille-P4043]|uniref:hypothetical protein n=1 Tax=Lentibacillus sp. Marseille-P4043 TaxID=2040293 RepID=UPI000D0B2614|nr:hypothetical protein [Lentibacillus sp. Marseille-P4043]